MSQFMAMGLVCVDMRVAVLGATGKMGREVVRAVDDTPGMRVVGGLCRTAAGGDAGEAAGIGRRDAPLLSDLEAVLALKPDAVVDFTAPDSVRRNVARAVQAGVGAVVGTTGLDRPEWDELGQMAEQAGVGIVFAPNFAVGAVLLMRFTQEASRYFSKVEIIEMHHDRKRDAPSGTALYTANLIQEGRSAAATTESVVEDEERLQGVRGGDVGGVRIHSVRLPGLVAHQEVLLGLPGQTLTLRHDSYDRASFMPGVVLALQRLPDVRGLVYGLEHLM